MNIQHLRYVVEVERAGSISRAAENLYMGQPNLSKAIKELEQQLEITIFRRTAKGTELTSTGRDFLHYAKNILAQYEEMEALGGDGGRKKTQAMRLSLPRASYMVEAFTDFVSTLDMEKPIQIDFYETNALRAIRNVADARSDFGMIRCHVNYQSYFKALLNEQKLESRDILTFSYRLVMHKNHPLAEQEDITHEQLQHYIEIIHGDTTLPHMEAEETERGRTPGDKKIYVHERGSQFDLLARLPMCYMWVSPLPEDLLKRNNLIQIPSESSSSFKDMLIYPKGYRFSELEQALIARIDQYAATIMEAN